MKTQTEFDADGLNLVSLAKEYSNERKARKLFESLRWPGGKPICPHCGFDECYQLTSKTDSKTKLRDGVYECAACRKPFTATVGTVFESSHVPLSKILIAIFILCSSKKSVSALQLSRMLKTTYRTAWFLAHRIRHALADDGKTKLSGVVEIDETFIGGKGNRKTRLSRLTPVMALIEQGGNMKAHVVPNVSFKNLGKVLFESVNKDAVVCSDENTAYKTVKKILKRITRSITANTNIFYGRRTALPQAQIVANRFLAF